MGRPRPPAAARNATQRQRIAAAAAALLGQGAVHDVLAARRKAAQQLGITDPRLLPDREEIEAALRAHQRLFAAPEQADQIRRLRLAAREAMQFFAKFDPRLVGAVLDGSADRHSAVGLHLFCDDPEAVLRHLHDHGIGFRQRVQRKQLDRERSVFADVLELSADEVPFELTVLPVSALRQPPLDRDGERPEPRASLAQLDKLLASPD